LFFTYCPCCGARVEPRCGGCFRKRPSADRLRLERALKGTKTISQVIAVLGEPDERQDSITFDEEEREIYGSRAVRELVRYTRVSETIDIVAQELEGGTLQIFYRAKPKGGL